MLQFRHAIIGKKLIMNAAHEEQEQLEALRRWWDSYGRPVVLGGVVGLAALLGYQWYDNQQTSKAIAASGLYQQLTAGGTAEAAEAANHRLVDEFSGTPYATLALLGDGARASAAGDLDLARQALARAMETAPDHKLRELARLNLARVELAAGNATQAITLAERRDRKLYPVLFLELVGDAHTALGNREEARTAYRAALDVEQVPQQLAALIRLKLESLGSSS